MAIALRWSPLVLVVSAACQVVAGLETREVGVAHAPDAGDGSAPCGTTCGGACVDVSTDKNNCGFCGHSCGGGECTSGLCETRTLVTDTTCAGLALSNTAVFCAEATSGATTRVYSVPREGGAVTELATSSESPVGLSRAPSGRLFVATTKSIGEIKGGNPSPFTLTQRTDGVTIRGIIADDTDVFFTTTRGVWRQKLDGSAAIELVPETTTPGLAFGAITADDATVYYARGRYLHSIPRNGGADTVVGNLGRDQDTPLALFREGDFLVAGNNGAGRINVGGVTPGPIVPYTAFAVLWLTASNNRVFWMQAPVAAGQSSQLRMTPVDAIGLEAQRVLVDGLCTTCTFERMASDASLVVFTHQRSLNAVPL